MAKEIKVKLTKLLSFLKGIDDGSINDQALKEMIPILEDTFKNKVLGASHEGGVFEIPTQADLEVLIMSNKGSVDHRPSKLPQKAKYTPAYLRRKQTMDKGPHTYLRMGIVKGTKVRIKSDAVRMETDDNQVTRDGVNYAKIQEQRKSYLKSTFYWAWADLIKAIIDKYIDNLK